MRATAAFNSAGGRRQRPLGVVCTTSSGRRPAQSSSLAGPGPDPSAFRRLMGTPYQRHLQGEQQCSPCWSSRKPSGGGASALVGVTSKMEGSKQGDWSIAPAGWQSCRAREGTVPREQRGARLGALVAFHSSAPKRGRAARNMAAALGGMPGSKPLAKLPEEGKRENKVSVPRECGTKTHGRGAVLWRALLGVPPAGEIGAHLARGCMLRGRCHARGSAVGLV